MQKSLLSVSGIVVMGAILLLVNGLADRLFGRLYFDMTEEKLYSLSEGSKNILRSIEDPITLKYYFSKTEGAQEPALKLYGDRILDLLREYERLGRGKIRFEVYDPRPDSDEEEWAQKYGVQQISTRDGRGLFLGLVGVNALGEEKAIPVFNVARQELLEYDISKLVSSLSVEKKPVIGVLTGLPLNGGGMPQEGGEQKWLVTQLLEELGEVRFLTENATSIDKEIGLLLVVHPKQLSASTQYAVDQFVMHGGKLIAFVDPFCQADEPAPDPNNPYAGMMADRSSNLNVLLKKWGVELAEKKVVADLNLATLVNTGRGEAKRFVPWVGANRSVLEQGDVSTGQLEQLMFPWPGVLKRVNVEGVTVTPLIRTTTDSQLVDDTEFKFGGGDPDKLLRNFSRSGEEYILAARISGKLQSAFPEGRPKEEPKEGETPLPPAEHLGQSSEVAHVVVIADVDFLTNRIAATTQNIFGAQVVSLVNDNLNFVQNVVENLLGSTDLISIRSRGRFSREFTVVQQLETRAQQRWQQEEAVLQARLTNANQRLAQLQSTAGEGSKAVVTKAIIDEINKFRQQKIEAQASLREIRRYLREDIERLGNRLFLINTFGAPFLLIVGTVAFQLSRKGKRKAS